MIFGFSFPWLAADHYDKKRQDIANTGLLHSVAFMPKENCECLVAMWLSVLNFFKEEFNIDLMKWLHAVSYDASAALKEAHMKVFGQTKIHYFRDLRHQIATSEKTGKVKAIQKQFENIPRFRRVRTTVMHVGVAA